jgi:penicillin-binding protein 2
MAAVVIDVAEGDVLAMVSLPLYDLSLARYRYEDLAADANQPLVNRVLNWHYPPGSVVKPVVLVAGLQTGLITPDEVISCPSRYAPQGWPSCWIFRSNGYGHDKLWPNANYARNAIKGSCNIYFSRLADRIEPRTLQEWLFAFGYGRQAQFAYPITENPNDQTSPDPTSRRLRQVSGQISSRPEYGAFIQGLDQIPPLDPGDRALVGIGEDKFLASPIQVAGAMAALARHGVYKPPRLFLPSDANSPSPSSSPDKTTNLGLAEQTLETVYEGLYAVVNEPNGTANLAFKNHPPAQQGLSVYGKTGSTQRPDHAWFAGFAKDSAGRTIALALVVEGGQSGSSDAAPLGREIIGFCVEAGYLGR